MSTFSCWSPSVIDSTALLALRMASASGLQVSSNSPAARSTRNCSCDESWRTATGALVLLRNRPGYTNKATKRAMLAAAATINFTALPLRAVGTANSGTARARNVSACSALAGAAVLAAAGSLLAAFSVLAVLSYLSLSLLSFLSFLSALSFLTGLSALTGFWERWRFSLPLPALPVSPWRPVRGAPPPARAEGLARPLARAAEEFRGAKRWGLSAPAWCFLAPVAARRMAPRPWVQAAPAHGDRKS